MPSSREIDGAPWVGPVVRGLREIADLAWPSSCVGCGRWGAAWCAACEHTLVGEGLHVRPSLAPHLVVHAAESFDGPLRRAVTALKDEGRRDAAAPLGLLARRAVAHAIADADVVCDATSSPARRGIVLVPIPSSRASFRTRGRHPLAEVAARVRAGTPIIDGARVLRHRGHVRDQSRLTRAERGVNVAGAFGAGPDAAHLLVRQPLVVLFDDVVTSGATMSAAHRALTRAGAVDVVCAAVAATPLEGHVHTVVGNR